MVFLVGSLVFDFGGFVAKLIEAFDDVLGIGFAGIIGHGGMFNYKKYI